MRIVVGRAVMVYGGELAVYLRIYCAKRLIHLGLRWYISLSIHLRALLDHRIGIDWIISLKVLLRGHRRKSFNLILRDLSLKNLSRILYWRHHLHSIISNISHRLHRNRCVSYLRSRRFILFHKLLISLSYRILITWFIWVV